MKICILSDNIPGHFNQSFGMMHLLFGRSHSNFSVIYVTPRIHFLRSITRFLCRLLSKNISKTKANFILWTYSINLLDKYDLIIASGGNTAAVCSAIQFLKVTKSIQLGSPRGLPASNFTAIVTSERYFDSENNVVADITPNKYSPNTINQLSNKDSHILFCIGGKGIGYEYSDTEWDSFINNVKKIANKHEKQICLVTSRRTNPNVERKLALALDSFIDHKESGLFHAGSSNFDLSNAFSISAHIFVTEDSAMMISESISSGRPVSTIYPKRINAPIRFKNHIKKYEKLGFIKRLSIENFDIDHRNNSSDLVSSNRQILKEQIMELIS